MKKIKARLSFYLVLLGSWLIRISMKIDCRYANVLVNGMIKEGLKQLDSYNQTNISRYN